MNKSNIDNKTVEGFGDEWTRFDQSGLPATDHHRIFNNYFMHFPWHILPPNAEGFDLGCGSGRWAKLVAPKVGVLHCIEPSKAILVAEKNLEGEKNCIFHNVGVDNMPMSNESMDFGYSLGVLHHIPNTQEAMKKCVDKIKKGGPFLVYIYYAFDNKPSWFKVIWKISDLIRKGVSKTPYEVRYIISQIIALLVYWPLARFSKLCSYLGIDAKNIPLYAYRNASVYVMRTDALDRFGTRLEQRFTREEIKQMMTNVGLSEIKFVEDKAFWCAVGIKQ